MLTVLTVFDLFTCLLVLVVVEWLGNAIFSSWADNLVVCRLRLRSWAFIFLKKKIVDQT